MMPSLELAEVAVCVLTYKRGPMLTACLESLAAQSGVDRRWRIVVVDNDSAASARERVEVAQAGDYPPIQYVVEAEPGISAARNAAVANASNAEFIAFIDDDEVADPTWLSALLIAQADYDADVVQGSVQSQLEPGGPTWVSRGRFFDRRLTARGAPLATAAAGNVLIRTSVLAQLQGPFNLKYGMTGGEDTHLFCQLRKMGNLIISAPEARVIETIPITRQSIRWLLTRSLRSSSTWSRIEREILHRRLWRSRRVFSAAYSMALSTGSTALGIVTFRKDRVARGVCHAGRAIGALGGLTHIDVNEYRRRA